MSANRDGENHIYGAHEGVREQHHIVDWAEIANRSVGCQTKESALQSHLTAKRQKAATKT